MGGKDMSQATHFICCEKCGKKLIERYSNGIFKFRFGRRGENSEPAVDLEIYGSLKIKCLRRSCDHVNVLNFFPMDVKHNNSGKPEDGDI